MERRERTGTRRLATIANDDNSSHRQAEITTDWSSEPQYGGKWVNRRPTCQKSRPWSQVLLMAGLEDT